jgi:predicted nuclease with TOPRIM domain
MLIVEGRIVRVMAQKKPAVTRVKPSRLERWKQEVEESNRFNSLSQALRVGFEQLFSESGDTDEELIKRLDNLENEVRENRKKIERIPAKQPTIEEITDAMQREVELESYIKTRYHPFDFGEEIMGEDYEGDDE